jgi:hypothetical protein
LKRKQQKSEEKTKHEGMRESRMKMFALSTDKSSEQNRKNGKRYTV